MTKLNKRFHEKTIVIFRIGTPATVLTFMICWKFGFEGRLTKRVLMTLPSGMLLQSNICIGGPNQPALEVVLGDPESRHEVWARVRSLGLAGTKFRGFCEDRTYRLHMAQREFILIRHPPVVH